MNRILYEGGNFILQRYFLNVLYKENTKLCKIYFNSKTLRIVKRHKWQLRTLSTYIMHCLCNLRRDYFYIHGEKDFHALIYSYTSTGNKRNFNKYVGILENDLYLLTEIYQLKIIIFQKEQILSRMLKFSVKMCSQEKYTREIIFRVPSAKNVSIEIDEADTLRVLPDRVFFLSRPRCQTRRRRWPASRRRRRSPSVEPFLLHMRASHSTTTSTHEHRYTRTHIRANTRGRTQVHVHLTRTPREHEHARARALKTGCT